MIECGFCLIFKYIYISAIKYHLKTSGFQVST